MTTRDGASNKNALWVTGAERSSTTRVPVSDGAMRTPRTSAAKAAPEAPAMVASSSNAVVDRFPKKPFSVMEFSLSAAVEFT